MGAIVGAPVELDRPSNAQHGDYATNAALKLAGARRRPPRELAAELAEQAAKLPHVERAEIAGPGFVNLFLEDAWFAEALGDCVARLLEFAGHEVEREYYYNDSGRQMDLFRESVEAARRGEPPPEDGYRGE